MKISFYPGPSTVHKEIPQYVADAYAQGILSINHRSAAFAKILKRTASLLKEKLNIPEEYEVVFTSSATECWEIIAQSLLNSKSFHFYNGDFGSKWLLYTQRLKKGATGVAFGLNDELDVNKNYGLKNAEIICLTQNETSNGTQVSNKVISEFRIQYPEKLIAIDATSSMAGMALDIPMADVWFASVQKCFGLPAGLGLMACSPGAVKRAYELNENSHYNSLVFMLDNVRNFQTHYTPNVLNIYLLMRILEVSPSILEVEKRLFRRYEILQRVINNLPGLQFLSHNESVRSKTVLAISGSPDYIEKLFKEAEGQGILLGKGYGTYKSNTFRIANFPAISEEQFQNLIDFLNSRVKD